jgi:outer membrane lipoprotein-sorting protein
MRKIMGASLVFGLLLAGVGFVRSGDDKDARAIIAKAIKAEGGEAKLAKLKAMTWKEKGTYYGMGDGLPYTGVYAVQWPGQFRMEIEGVFTIVLNGDKGWTQAGGATKEMTKDELAMQIHNQRAGWISSLVPLADKEFQLKAVGEAKVGKQMVQVVQVSRKDYPDVKLYFAKDTGLLVKSEFRTKAAEQEFKEVSQAMYFSDYRDVDGAKHAHKLVIKRDDKVYVETEITDLKAAGKLDAKVFARPGD